MEQFYYEYNKKGISVKQYIYWVGSYHYNWHKDIELLTMLDGAAEVCIDGVSHVLETGDMILINSNKGHATMARQENTLAMVLHIAPEVVGSYFDNVEYLEFSCCSDSKTRSRKPFPLMRSNLAEMFFGYEKDTPEGRLQFESAFYSLLHTIVLYFPPQRLPLATAMIHKNTFDAVKKIVGYVDKNYARRITLNDLAKVSMYNKNYVSQFFKSYLGINFYDYLTRIRLREATLELGRTQRSISDIAMSHGFPDLKAFNTAFRNSFGKTPSEYRRQLSEDVTKYDINFKKTFLPRSSEVVNHILMEYITEKYGGVPSNSVSSPAQMAGTVQAVSDVAFNLQQMTKTLCRQTEELEKVIWTLTE